MSKEKILQELMTRAAKSGCSERTIQAYVDNITIPDDEAQITDQFYAGHVSILTAMGGQMSRGIAEQVADFKKNYKPAPTPPRVDPPEDPNKEIAAELKAIRERLDREDKARARKELLTSVSQMLNEQGATNESLRDLILKNAEVKDDDTADTLAERYKREYDDQYKKLYGDGGVPATGGGQGSTRRFDAKAEVARLRAEGLLPPENK